MNVYVDNPVEYHDHTSNVKLKVHRIFFIKGGKKS